jgi:ABC-2 type transport system ATP-binding protein
MPDQRADEVLAMVGLTDAANRKVGGFSLGMRQRLALATALLGDPPVLILDEPGSGLDPEGVAWLRGFLRSYAATGRTVLVSSHQLAEIAQTVDRVVIISQGAGVFEGPIEELPGEDRDEVRVRCSDPGRLATALSARGITEIASLPEGWLSVLGADTTTVGDLARTVDVAVYGMTREHTDLEQRFLRLTVSQYRPAEPVQSDSAPDASAEPARSDAAHAVPAQREGDR